MSTIRSLLQILQQVPPTSFQHHVPFYALLSSVSAEFSCRVLHWSMGKILGYPSNHQLSMAPHAVVRNYETLPPPSLLECQVPRYWRRFV